MSSPDEIRRQLSKMRSALQRDARDAAVDARTLVDWRYHFRRHPWLYCAGAATVGYLVVPRRPRPFEVDASSFKNAATLQPPPAGQVSPQDSVSVGMLKAAVGIAAGALVRRAISHLVERGRRQFEESMSAGSRTESNGARARSPS